MAVRFRRGVSDFYPHGSGFTSGGDWQIVSFKSVAYPTLSMGALAIDDPINGFSIPVAFGFGVDSR